MFEKNFEYIGVFVGYLQKILEMVGNFIALISGKTAAADDAAPADEGGEDIGG